MGKKKEQRQEELLDTLGDFTSKENWDKFFSIRGSEDSFEWYAEWPQLKDPLLSHLSPPPEASTTSASSPPSLEIQILVPGCGNSRLSEHLYDAGFHYISNIDFSTVVISDMLRRNVRPRPHMRWRVMDMTNLLFVDETFDVVLDKGALDALMEPELGPKLGNQYISEVRRVIKSGGKFICLTLAESHVLGLLFPKFRYGWTMSIHAIPQILSNKPGLQTFMVIAEKDNSTVLSHISPSFSQSSLDCYGRQAHGLNEALENENKIRQEHANVSDILYSLEDLKLGAKGDLAELSPGRRVQLTLGESGESVFIYRGVLLDAKLQSGPFSYHCGVFLVPKTRAHEWLFSSEEGQWLVVDSSKAARLIMVFLDSSLANSSMDDIQKSLSPLVKQLAPGENDTQAQIPFMAASDGIKQRKIVCEVTSALTGPIVVDDVVYEKLDDKFSCLLPSRELIFRRLTFQRTEGLVQSEALLTSQEPDRNVGEQDQKKTRSSSKSKKRGNQRRNVSHASPSDELSKELKVEHDYLASSYHVGIISGFVLISGFLENVVSTGGMAWRKDMYFLVLAIYLMNNMLLCILLTIQGQVKAIVIGLGAGLLPMFLHRFLPVLHIQVLELDPVVLSLARDYFGFREDEQLKVTITDGIKFMREIAISKEADVVAFNHGNGNDIWNVNSPAFNEGPACQAEVEGTNNKIDILIIDVDSSDSSSGLTCPAADFVEESFLSTAKSSLSEQGLFVINLVSRSSAIKDLVFSRMKKAFSNVFCLQLEEDVNEVIFACKVDVGIKEDCFSEASHHLEKLMKSKNLPWSQSTVDAAKKIRRVS